MMAKDAARPGNGLDEKFAATDPFQQFGLWFNDARAADADNANAVTLSTAGELGIPTARVVLLKDFSEKGFVFYTNYASQKAKDISESPLACLNFYWPALQRQVRINGTVVRLKAIASDRYFESRSKESKLGSWASAQSAVVSGRQELEQKFGFMERKFAGRAIPRPDHWGGYIVVPYYFEFWQGRAHRFHDRIVYQLDDEKQWQIGRLAP